VTFNQFRKAIRQGYCIRKWEKGGYILDIEYPIRATSYMAKSKKMAEMGLYDVYCVMMRNRNHPARWGTVVMGSREASTGVICVEGGDR
jgi:hypothetical protein